MLDWIIDRNIKEFYKIQDIPPFKIFKFNLDNLKLETIGTFKTFKENLIHKNNNISNSNYKSKKYKHSYALYWRYYCLHTTNN